MDHSTRRKTCGPANVGGCGANGLALLATPLSSIKCPLCGLEFPPYMHGDSQGATCPGCHLNFALSSRAGGHSAGAAAADSDLPRPSDPLGRWLAGDPITPRNPTNWERLRRWCRRRPVMAGLAMAAVLLVTAAGVVGVAEGYYLSAELRDCRRMRGAAEQSRTSAESIASECTERAAEQQALTRRETFARQRAERTAADADACRQAAERRLAEAERQRLQAAREGRIALVRQLARESRQVLLTHPASSLFLGEQALRAMLQESEAPDRAVEQTVRDGLAMLGGLGLRGHQQAVLAVAISRDGRWLATGGADKTARLWDLAAQDPGASAAVLSGHQGPVSAVAFSPDRRWLATGAQDGTVILWDLAARNPAESPVSLRGHRAPIRAMAISADSRWLLSAGGNAHNPDDSARLWDLRAQDPAGSVIELRGHLQPIWAAAISPDGRWAALGGEDTTIRLFDLKARFPAAEQTVLRGHEGCVAALAVSPDSRWLASGSYDHTARLWDLKAADPAGGGTVLGGHEGWVAAVAFSPDGRWVATGSFDKTARLWSLMPSQTHRAPIALVGHEGPIRTLGFSSDGDWLMTGSHDKTARLWDMATPDPSVQPLVLRGHDGPVNAVAVSPDGCWLATVCGEGTRSDGDLVRLWNLRLDGLLQTAGLAAARHLDADQREAVLTGTIAR